jgi:hypothetical protein
MSGLTPAPVCLQNEQQRDRPDSTNSRSKETASGSSSDGDDLPLRRWHWHWLWSLGVFLCFFHFNGHLLAAEIPVQTIGGVERFHTELIMHALVPIVVIDANPGHDGDYVIMKAPALIVGPRNKLCRGARKDVRSGVVSWRDRNKTQRLLSALYVNSEVLPIDDRDKQTTGSRARDFPAPIRQVNSESSISLIEGGFQWDQIRNVQIVSFFVKLELPKGDQDKKSREYSYQKIPPSLSTWPSFHRFALLVLLGISAALLFWGSVLLTDRDNGIGRVLIVAGWLVMWLWGFLVS